jgi:hypothetical protein
MHIDVSPVQMSSNQLQIGDNNSQGRVKSNSFYTSQIQFGTDNRLILLQKLTKMPIENSPGI